MPPINSDVWVQYDGTKVVKGLRKRVRKRFPGGWGRAGLKRAVKVFWQQKTREGKRPTILEADGVTPMYGPQSSAAKRQHEERRARERAEQLCTEQGVLFDNTPDGLPD